MATGPPGPTADQLEHAIEQHSGQFVEETKAKARRRRDSALMIDVVTPRGSSRSSRGDEKEELEQGESSSSEEEEEKAEEEGESDESEGEGEDEGEGADKAASARNKATKEAILEEERRRLKIEKMHLAIQSVDSVALAGLVRWLCKTRDDKSGHLVSILHDEGEAERGGATTKRLLGEDVGEASGRGTEDELGGGEEEKHNDDQTAPSGDTGGLLPHSPPTVVPSLVHSLALLVTHVHILARARPRPPLTRLSPLRIL